MRVRKLRLLLRSPESRFPATTCSNLVCLFMPVNLIQHLILIHLESGILVVDVIGGQLDKKARLELLLDEGYWPSFSTEKARSTQAKWKEVGEGFIKELDFGRVWLRLNENDEGLKDDIIGEMKMDAKAFLDQCLVSVSCVMVPIFVTDFICLIEQGISVHVNIGRWSPPEYCSSVG